MARSIRIEYPGAFYHVMARGNRRENIFSDDEDRRFFLRTLAEACGMTGWRIHAWTLMSNHYHLFMETPEPNLVAGMQWLQNAYTRRYNSRHRTWGRLFGDRYKSVLVEGADYYFETLLDYIHLNPVRAGLIDPFKKQSVLDYPWSSVAAGYGLPTRKRSEWMTVQQGLAVFGWSDTAAGRRRFVERLDRRAVEERMEGAGLPPLRPEIDGRCSHLRRGWYWGSQSFAERVMKLGEKALKKDRHRGYRGSGEIRAHGEREARRILEESLRDAGLTKQDLQRLPGSAEEKVRIAAKIRAHTPMSMKWISDQLAMKSAANASQQIRRYRTKDALRPHRSRERQSKNVA